MNKKELIKEAAGKAGLSFKSEQEAIDAFLGVISDALKKEDDVVIPDFGRFTVQKFAERRIRHPKTGEAMVIPSTKRVRFKPYGNITEYAMKYGI